MEQTKKRDTENKAQRKTRSDKKRDVKPTIEGKLYDTIDRISYITATPIKHVGEAICMAGIESEDVIEHLSVNFRKDFWLSESILFVGDPGRLPVNIRGTLINKRRITMRFSQPVHDKISALAYACDTSVSAAAGMLLQASILNADILNRYITRYVTRHMEPKKFKQLQAIMRYINQYNPYEHEKVSLAAILNMLADEVVHGTKSVMVILDEWIDKYTDNKKK